MAKIVIQNETTPPPTEGLGKTVIYTKNDGIYLVLGDGSSLGPVGPNTGTAGGDLSGTYPNPVIATGAVTSGKIATGAVGATQLADDAVTTVKILDGNVTQAKLNTSVQNLLPTANQKSALAGTNGTPSGTNKYVTDSDPRLSGGGGGITALTGEVTASGSGSVAATITALAVTSAKIAAGAVDSSKLAVSVSGVLPTSDEKAALVGTNGTPGSGNEYVTTTDPRMTDARSPSQLQFAFDATATGASPLIIGSVYLSSGMTIKAASRAMIGGSLAGETALLELRRFTGGALLATFAPGAGTLQDVFLSGGVDVPVATSDWYDLYLSETGGGTALAKGLQLVLS